MLDTKGTNVYLDYNATTPTDQRVIEAMIPTFKEQFGNPSSANHEAGRTASELVEKSRSAVADLVGMKSSDVIFTSGATEANNMALHGFVYGIKKRPHILVGATEHKSILETCCMLTENDLADVDIIPVDPDGLINPDKLAEILTDDVDLISVMSANSETGVINPIDKITKIAHEYDILVHCDATQAVGKIPFKAEDLDMISISSHKIYGPKGCGALVSVRHARKQIQPILWGGGQENNLRSGTLNVPGIVGFGAACAIIQDTLESSMQESLRDYFEHELQTRLDGISVNGNKDRRLPNTSNVRIAGALADAVMVNAPAIAISTGSACSSSAMEPSHVLTAMGLTRDEASECIRVSVGRDTTKDDIDVAIEELIKAVNYVRDKEKLTEESVYNAH